MRNGQNKRMRGRNRKGQNPLTRVYESNGPDVKIRGTANHIAEKYIQLARDALGSGDPVSAENYYQHAEHYFRLIATAQEQFRQTTPFYQGGPGGNERSDDSYDDGDDEQPMMGGEPGYAPQPQFQPRAEQPYPAREPQPFVPRGEQQTQPQGNRQPQPGNAPSEDLGRLPSFITGGQQQPGSAANGHENGGQQERYGVHRRRRRHRGPRGELAGAAQPGGSEAGDDAGPHPGNE